MFENSQRERQETGKGMSHIFRGMSRGSTWNRKFDIEECKFNAGEVMHPLEPLLKVQRRHLNEGIVNRD